MIQAMNTTKKMAKKTEAKTQVKVKRAIATTRMVEKRMKKTQGVKKRASRTQTPTTQTLYAGGVGGERFVRKVCVPAHAFSASLLTLPLSPGGACALGRKHIWGACLLASVSAS